MDKIVRKDMSRPIFLEKSRLMRRILCLGVLLWATWSPLLAAEEDKPAAWDKVKQWFEDFETYVERTDLITPGELQKLPVGLRTTIGNTNYDLFLIYLLPY